jgi:hypothetical protein
VCDWDIYVNGENITYNWPWVGFYSDNSFVNEREGEKQIENGLYVDTGFRWQNIPTHITLSVTPVVYTVLDYIPGTSPRVLHPNVNTYVNQYFDPIDGREEADVFANTTYDEPWQMMVPIWSRTSTGNGVVNVQDGILSVVQFNPPVIRHNNDTTFTVNITVTHNAGQTTYTDINGDGTVECGLFYAWMDGPTGGELNVSVRSRPPTANIISIIPGAPLVGQVVAFSGAGTDHQGNAIVAFEWTSGSFNYSFFLLSNNPNFQMQATNSTGGLTKGYQLIYFRVQNSAGLWSPMVTKPVSVG